MIDSLYNDQYIIVLSWLLTAISFFWIPSLPQNWECNWRWMTHQAELESWIDFLNCSSHMNLILAVSCQYMLHTNGKIRTEWKQIVAFCIPSVIIREANMDINFKQGLHNSLIHVYYFLLASFHNRKFQAYGNLLSFIDGRAL